MQFYVEKSELKQYNKKKKQMSFLNECFVFCISPLIKGVCVHPTEIIMMNNSLTSRKSTGPSPTACQDCSKFHNTIREEGSVCKGHQRTGRRSTNLLMNTGRTNCSPVLNEGGLGQGWGKTSFAPTPSSKRATKRRKKRAARNLPLNQTACREVRSGENDL